MAATPHTADVVQNVAQGDSAIRAPKPELSRTPVLTTAAARALFPIALFVLAFGLAWFRLPSSASNTLWAEDGALFLQTASADPSWLLTFEPYAGYLHVVPRIVARLVWDTAPLALMPAAMAAASIAVTAGVAVLVFYLSADVGVRLPGRFLLYGITFLAPALPVEVLGNVANVHWFFLWLAPWLFLARPRTRWGGIGLGVVALLATLTEPQMLLLFPLVFWRFRRDKKWWIMAAAAVGLAVQLGVGLFYPRPDGGGYYFGLDALTVIGAGFVIQVGGAMWLNLSPALYLIKPLGWVLGGIAIFLPVIAAIVAAAFSRSRRQILLIGMFVAGSIALWSASGIVNDAGRSGLLDSVYWAGNSDRPFLVGLLRYAVVPALFLTAAVVIVADEWLAKKRWVFRTPALVMIAVLAITSAYSFYGGSRVARQPSASWDSYVTTAQATCEAQPELAAYPIPIQPSGWYFSISCDRLR